MTSLGPSSLPPSHNSSRKARREHTKQRKRRRMARFFAGTLITFAILIGGLVAFAFLTPWGRSMRLTLAETIITTRHYQWAHYITTDKEYAALAKQLNAPTVNTGVPSIVHIVTQKQEPSAVEFQSIDEQGFTGYVMLVHNPKLVRLVPAHVTNGMGEYVSDMVKRTQASAGVNASGFEDPKGAGWGGQAVGLVMVDGKVLIAPRGTASWTTVGFTKDGVMVMGNYSVAQLRNMGVRDAMQFHPELIVNGKPMITSGTGGWGYDPRTAIGQTKDGTVIFVVINGRFHGNSNLGASQRQVMDIMLRYGAVNACAMDGGSSSVLYGQDQILNSPSTLDPNHQRHLPDAWLVFPSESSAASVGS